MDKVYRKGAKVDVAFNSAISRTDATDAVPSRKPHAGIAQDITGSVAQPAGRRRWRALVRVLVRRVAVLVYRCISPVLRPVAFRTRNFFMEGFRLQVNEVRAEMSRIHDASIQELHRVSNVLLEQARAMPDEHLKISAGIVQELQAARDFLRVDFHREMALLKSEVLPALARLDRIEQYSGAAARRIALNCDNGGILVRTEVGYVMCPASDPALLATLIEAGELERGTRLLIQRLLRPGDVFVDIGANIGMHTLAAARAMQGRGKIVAFEPFAATAALLEKSIWLNGFSQITEIHEAAVSVVTGRQTLFLGATSGHHSLFPVEALTQKASGQVDVRVVRLDDIIDATEAVSLIKIDVEGAELQVLESATSIIRNNPQIALIVEFGPSHLLRAGSSPKDWLAAFTRFGLSRRAIDAETGQLEDWSTERLEQVESINLLFARAGASVLSL